MRHTADSTTQRGAAADAGSGHGGLTLSSLLLPAICVDLLLLTPAVWALARAHGIALWPASSPLTAYFLLLPAVIVTGAWAAHLVGSRRDNAFLPHLARTGLGAALAALAATAIFAVAGGSIGQVPLLIPAAGIVLIAALHANYLGAARSFIRAGLLEPSPKNPER